MRDAQETKAALGNGCRAIERAHSSFKSQFADPSQELGVLFKEIFGTEILFEEANLDGITKLDEFRVEKGNCTNVEAKADKSCGVEVSQYPDLKPDTRSAVPQWTP